MADLRTQTSPVYIGLSSFVPFAVLHCCLCLCPSLLLSVFLPLHVSLLPASPDVNLALFSSVSHSPACTACRTSSGRPSAGPLDPSPALCRPALPLSWGGSDVVTEAAPRFSSRGSAHQRLSTPLPDQSLCQGAAWGPAWTITPAPGLMPSPG